MGYAVEVILKVTKVNDSFWPHAKTPRVFYCLDYNSLRLSGFA